MTSSSILSGNVDRSHMLTLRWGLLSIRVGKCITLHNTHMTTRTAMQRDHGCHDGTFNMFLHYLGVFIVLAVVKTLKLYGFEINSYFGWKTNDFIIGTTMNNQRLFSLNIDHPWCCFMFSTLYLFSFQLTNCITLMSLLVLQTSQQILQLPDMR